MNINEAITSAVNEIIDLSNSYIGRIFIEGIVEYEQPVDLRINKINLPLRSQDISFLYEKIKKQDRIHKCDCVLSTYYPLGSELHLANCGDIKLISYGPIKKYNNKTYVDMYCKLVDEKITLIESINSINIENKIKSELNTMIESNEIIKNLLPQYSHNWLKFSDDDLDAVKKFNATKILSIIDMLNYEELNYYMEEINSILSSGLETLPSSVTKSVKDISEIVIDNRIMAGFSDVHSYYNPRYVFQWIIYVYLNMVLKDESLHNDFYLVNKIGEKTTIHVSGKSDNILLYFKTPDESQFNYRLEINNCKQYGDYIKYNIESIKLVKINKQDLSEIENTNVSTNQTDYLKVCTEIFSILSATNYDLITLTEYYENIDTYLNSITTMVETGEDNTNEGGETQ